MFLSNHNTQIHNLTIVGNYKTVLLECDFRSTGVLCIVTTTGKWLREQCFLLQDGTTCHIARETMVLLHETFPGRDLYTECRCKLTVQDVRSHHFRFLPVGICEIANLWNVHHTRHSQFTTQCVWKNGQALGSQQSVQQTNAEEGILNILFPRHNFQG